MNPAINSTSDLNRLVSDFEQAWLVSGNAELSTFLPPEDHSQFGVIACELVCIDVEMRWSRAISRSVSEYQELYPRLFKDRRILEELAFEDYRQRILAGSPIPANVYRDKYGVEVSSWPKAPEPADAEGARTQVMDAVPANAELRSAVIAAVRNSDPRSADQLDEGLNRLPNCGDRLFGFNLVQELGEGAFAKVFLARQVELADRPVALKVAVALNDEPRKLARLQHTNIVPIYSTHHGSGLEAVCMPYLGSLTLDHLLKSMTSHPGSLPSSGKELLSTLFDRRSATLELRSRSRATPARPAAEVNCAVATPILDMMERCSHVEAVLWMGARIADGLAHAHERSILHLDLKPANILLTDDGQPMLLDFNLSIDLSVVPSIEMARLGGTLPYMSPEQLAAFGGGKRDIDARSDLFSLGCILHEMLTGTSPYPKRVGGIHELVPQLSADRKERILSPTELNRAISPAIGSIVCKLLEPDRNLRYQSAAQVREDLERQLADLPLKHAPDRSIPERTRKWCRRNPRSAVAVLVGAIAFFFFLMPASVLAYREDQIARRKLELEAAEAREKWREAKMEAQSVHVLLATWSGERARLEEGIERGRAVLEQYGIGTNRFWMETSAVKRLSEEERIELCFECGEMLFLMACAEELLTRDPNDRQKQEKGARTALDWAELAASCYPPGQCPRLLWEQRRQLLKSLPGEPDRLAAPERILPAEFDNYHEGVKHAMEGKYREALRFLILFSDEHPRHFQSWYVRGMCHDNLGENADAVACWTACLALDHDQHLVYFNRGLSRIRESDFRRAEQDFCRALKIEPNWSESLLNRAIARKSLGNYAGAIEDLDALVAANNSMKLRARFMLVEVKNLSKRPDEARADFLAAMKITPRDELDWSTRGYTRMMTEPAEALKDFDEAIALNQRSREALVNKSIVLSEFLNRPREAIAVLDQFLEFYPDHLGARLGRGVVLARIGECQKARADAETCLKLDRSPFFLFQAAGLFAQISRHEKKGDARKEALALLGTALQKGFADEDLFKTDPDLNPVRDDVEFKRLLEIVAGLKNSGAK